MSQYKPSGLPPRVWAMQDKVCKDGPFYTVVAKGGLDNSWSIAKYLAWVNSLNVKEVYIGYCVECKEPCEVGNSCCGQGVLFEDQVIRD